MSIDKTQEAIKKAEETIQKKYLTIEKKEKLIEKKRAKGDLDEISWLQQDIERLKEEIRDKYRILEGHRKKLEQEMQKASRVENMPEAFRILYRDTVDYWDAYDKMMRERYHELRDVYNEERKAIEEKRRRELEKVRGNRDAEQRIWDQFFKEEREHNDRTYKGLEPYETYAWLKDEEIHNNNLKAGQKLLLDVYDRTVMIVGEITDGSGLRVSRTNQGGAVINGIVTGNKGSAKIESIGAGGYNIQRWHIRVLIHPLRDRKVVSKNIFGRRKD